ncbi:MAG: 2'-deoxycytidine 5'-triphosphate deaminase [Alphaproteobacteria bacterium]|nr:2'-deoxycytidine 5'-triphosphate deaminase [Alphaproteobacteria bacterium]
MAQSSTLFTPSDDGESTRGHSTGILPASHLRGMIQRGRLQALKDIEDAQIQPASLDLRLGAVAWRIRASFLPGPESSVKSRIEQLALHQIDLTKGAVFEAGCVYIVPLLESVALPYRVSGIANPKSSTGRLDVFTRLITDRAKEFDRIEPGYEGPLYAEVSPRSFSILVREGSRLNQLRLRRGSPPFSDTELKRLQEEQGIVAGDADISNGIALTVDLKGWDGLVGYRAKRHAGLIDVDKPGVHDVGDFWEQVRARPDATMVLDPNEFYILASREAVSIPPEYAAEMVPYNPLVGEFRVHYAGFFDPGFGYSGAGGAGSRAVLEVRSHEVPFILTHGQIVGRLVFERLTEPPERVYGQGVGSNYQGQGLKLSKHFRV